MQKILENIVWLNSKSLAGNTLQDYLNSFFIFLLLVFILKIFQHVILVKLKEIAAGTKTDFDETLIRIFSEIKPPFYFFIAFYFGLSFLNLSEILSKTIRIIFLALIVFEIIRAMDKLIDFFAFKYLKKIDEENTQQEKEYITRPIKIILKIILWLLGITLVLANLGINVTSIVASLGIGGVAIALAVQNILGDIFSSFSIYIDKPFKVGDFIQIGQDAGIVEKIGLKTTRIRTLHGEELVISNHELTSARVQNFKKMENRRVSFTIDLVYGTDLKQLDKVPEIIKQIIDTEEMAEFSRCHFKEYGKSALIFEVVYFVNSPDYLVYMDTRQRINLAIYRDFQMEKINFAYPKTIFVKK